MITKNDCYLLLAEIKENGVDTNQVMKRLVSMSSPDIEVIKFINDNRELDLTRFYEKLRYSYNHKKSNLYKNIVKEIDEPQDVLTTLSAMLTQIILFSRNVEDKEMFLKHSRAYEISLVLNNYFKDYNLTNCLKLLRLIKIDLKALESIK